MGSLIPIGGGADAEIKGHLNAAFNPTNIAIVRSVVAKEKLFDGNRRLHRLAYRLGTYPIKTYSGDAAKGKWFFFLKNILRQAQHNGISTARSVTSILSYATRPGSVVARVVFDAQQATDGNPDYYVQCISNPLVTNPINDADIACLVDTTNTLNLTLICPAPLPDQSSPTPNQQGDVDKDANGSIIERPPIKIFLPQNLQPPTLSKKTRAPIVKGTKAKKSKKTKVKKSKKAKTGKRK